MGHLRRTDIISAYTRIKRDAVGRTCSVLILVAPTVDAICALKILTEVLRGDFIPFKVVPVAGYDDISAANDNFIQGRDEIRSVVLLDCGATVDLAEMLSVSPEMMVYLIDSHRPYALLNIFSNSQLLILDDGFIEENLTDLQHAYEGTKYQDQELSDDEEDSSDEDPDDAAQEDKELDDENRNPNLSSRRKSLKDDRRIQREYREMCIHKLNDYVQEGTWYGTSVARILLEIPDALTRQCNDYLWLAILGVTFQHLMEVSPPATFDLEVSSLRDQCYLLNTDTTSTNTTANGSTTGHGQIRYEPEFRFMLTRHWTLFNSMLHSRYMATRLGVWREKGKRMLETFIVKMGVPLAQCKVDYSSMELEMKESLPARISRHAGEFGIGDVLVPSFMREYGFVMRLSASDAVYALMALLEAPYSAMVYSSVTNVSINGGNGGEEGDRSPNWVKNFYYAFDALDSQNNIDKLRRGIELAMKQQQIVLHEASTILSHRLLRYGRLFRYVVLRHSSDLSWLSNHPLSLGKLALFLVEATSKSKRATTPLLLAAYQSLTDTYLVVAAPSKDSTLTGNVVVRSHFGLAFRRAATAVRARFKHDGFDSSLIEVKAANLKAFLQTLQTIPL